MEEDTEYLKLPLEDRCIHKLWKARVNGYEECQKHFPQIGDEKSPEFLKFAPLMKKFATDANAVALDKALDAVLAFAENAHISIAGRTAADVTAGVVAKCLAAPKKTTQDKALDVILMYCEIEKFEAVQEELMKGFPHKNPKVVTGCVKAITSALREFGSKVISIKLLVKGMGALLEHRDKNVRDEAKKMVVEMYRWAGQALKPQLTSLKPIQVQELEAEFENLPNEKPVQSRYLRSQQELKQKVAAQDDNADDDDADEPDAAEEIDPLDLMSPVNILEQLPKDFFDLVEAKKWQERKQAMETLLPLSQNAKLEVGDYADLLKALKKIIAKDTNVMIVALAGQCMAGIAKGLRKRFSIYAISCMETILEKFKEKKINVVTSLREAVDAIFQSSSIEAIQEIVCSALNNKNPNVKAETAAFLGRSFAYCTPVTLPKKLLKTYVTDLLKTLNEPDPTVRDNSAEALGTALKVVGEKVLDPFLVDVEPLKTQKIKEYAEKVEIKVKFKAPKPKPAPKSAPPSVKPPNRARVVKPSSAESKKPSLSSVGNVKKSAALKSSAIRGGASKVEECSEPELSLEEALEKATEVLSEEIISGITDTNWKSRLASVEDMRKSIESMDNVPTQALIKVLANKPGLKDNNFQVLKVKLETIKYLAENSSFTRRSAEACLTDLVEKFGDPKNGALVGEVFTAISDSAKLQYVGVEVMNLALSQKNPKIQEVAIKWLSDAIKEFGFVLQPKSLIANIKSSLSHSNPSVRTAAISLCGTIYMYMGPTLRVFLEDEKPALLQQIDAEFDKMSGVSPPTPTRGKTKSSVNASETDEEVFQPSSNDLQDMIPRTNISDQITPNLISELADKNWKVRIEALSKVASIINDAKFITADLGELPNAICSRLSDTNKNIGAEALRITSSLATALGPNCKPHTRLIVPGIFAALGDAKQSMRQQALIALNIWVEHLGSPKDIIDGDMCVDALKSASPFLKSELFLWMASKLKDAPTKTVNKEELNGCVGYLYAGLEDRNADIRKASNEAILPFMLHLGYDAMVRHTSKVKPSSKNTVTQVLEKAKPLMPVRSAPPSAKGKAVPPGRSSSSGPEKATSGVGRGSALRKGPVRSQSASKGGVGSSKKEEETDNSPLLHMNNLKQQRIVDEQRLRTLKWDMSTAPRAELVTQLKDQMTTANVNRQLMSNMFHQDFKLHMKAIGALSEDLHNNVDACVCNLDLILRWLTIRFFDTNPSVIIRAMEYLQNVFSYLSDDGYNITDYEAYSFLPTLIMKFGDPKDAIRGPARNIVKTICNIYPAGKISSYILDGVKSKNSRQRAECLETMGSLIEDFGISICQPSPAQALKDVAKQIADRDNSVRNAALNCLLQVYFREGEKVYKLIGHVSAKDQSLLEERIKRSAKNRPVIKKSPEPEPVVVRSGIGGGRINRVVPTTALPAPVIRDASSSAISPNENLGPRRPSFSSSSDYGSKEQLENWDATFTRKRRFKLSGMGSATSLSQSKSHLNNKSDDSGMNLGDCGSRDSISNICDNNDALQVDQILKSPIRMSYLQTSSSPSSTSSAALEQAKRISRSLSFVLGIPDEVHSPSEEGPSSGLPPLCPPNFPPPVFTRTVTSPQFSGYGQRPVSADMSNSNSRIQIDYDYLEQLVEDKIQPLEQRPIVALEEIPDLSSILNDKPSYPLTSSRLARPGFTSSVMRANVANANVDFEDGSQAINMVISQVATPDVNTVITALSQIDELIHNEDKRTQLITHVDQLLIVATLQYRLILTTKMNDGNIHKEECVRIYRSLTNCLMNIFQNKELGTRATKDVLHGVIHVIISILLDSRLNQFEDGDRIIRALNVLVVRIIEKAQFTQIFSALLKLLHESIGGGTVNSKFTELVMKCNWKGLRILPLKKKELDPVQILQDAHKFMVEYPSNVWVSKPENTPLRTIKTVVHNLVKVYGQSITAHLAQVPGTEGSEIQKYIQKDLNSIQSSAASDDGTAASDSNRTSANQELGVEVDTATVTLKSPRRLSKSANNTLSEIFKKIGSKENTKEGLILLYDFKLKNPDADIESFLRKSSHFFQNYIERGLKKVEMERQAESKMSISASSDGSTTSAPLSAIQVKDSKSVNVNELVDQFKAIAAHAGFDNTYIDSAVKDIYSAEKKSAPTSAGSDSSKHSD